MTDTRDHIANIAKAAAAATSVFSLATLPNHLHRILELFSHFRLQYLVAAALLAAVFFALRRTRWALSMLVLLTINAVPVLPWYMPEAHAVPAGGTPVKLLLSNIHAENESAAGLLDLVTREAPDVVIVQELTAEHARELVPLKDRYPYSLNIPRADNFGISLLSQLPFASARVIQSPPLEHPSLFVTVDIGGQDVTFVTTHPVPPLGQSGFAARNEQLADIGRLIADTDGPIVLIGDLNASMWGFHYRQLLETTGLTNSRNGFGLLPTWPAQLPFAMIPIDHCLVSDDFRTMDARTGPAVGSDHRTLIAELLLLR